MSEAELIEVFEAAWTNDGFVSREHEEARLAAGAPPAPLPRGAARPGRGDPDVRGARVQLHARRRPRPRPLGPGRRRTGREARPWSRPDRGCTHADVVTPTLGMLGRERVTITDYKSSDVRDPAKARQRARDSLQLAIYAMGYEAMTAGCPTPSSSTSSNRGSSAASTSTEAPGQGAQADRPGRGRDPRPRLHGTPRLPLLHVLRVPRHLPGQRGHLTDP